MILQSDTGQKRHHGRVARCKQLLNKKNTKAGLTFYKRKKHLLDPQDFWNNISWTDESKKNRKLLLRYRSHNICKQANILCKTIIIKYIFKHVNEVKKKDFQQMGWNEVCCDLVHCWRFHFEVGVSDRAIFQDKPGIFIEARFLQLFKGHIIQIVGCVYVDAFTMGLHFICHIVMHWLRGVERLLSAIWHVSMQAELLSPQKISRDTWAASLPYTFGRMEKTLWRKCN